jgi:lysophospholipase L1-like esterase
VVVGVLLVASLWANWLLYQESNGNYRDLNRVRLDPLGLRVFATEDPEAARAGGLPVVVFYGDSRAAEWTAPEGLTGYHFINRGIGAQTTTQILGRFAQDVAPLQPEVVILQAGINDLKTLPLFPDDAAWIVQNTKDNLARMVALAREAGAQQVILTTIFPSGAIPLERQLVWSPAVGEAVDEVNRYITSLEQEGVTIMATAPILADASGVVAGTYSRDALHLNAAGYAALNQELARLLTEQPEQPQQTK